MDYLTSADVWRITLFILAILLGFNGWWLFLRATAPVFLDRCAHAWRRPVRCSGVGVILVAVAGVGGNLLTNLAPGSKALMLLWVLVIGCLLVFALAGAAGLAARTGRRLPSQNDSASPWRAQLRGGIALTLAILLPIPGLFPGLPVLLIGGLGAAAFAFFDRSTPPES